MTISDERLAKLIGMLKRDALEKYFEEREMGGKDLSDTAAALLELQEFRKLLHEHWESDCEVAGCEMCAAGSKLTCPPAR